MIDGRKIEKFSLINLVDLAGSEKVGKTNATGDRLKEGDFLIVFFQVINSVNTSWSNQQESSHIGISDNDPRGDREWEEER